MDFPESLTAIVKDCAAKHASDINLAVDAAVAEWREQPERGEWLEQMEVKAIRAMIGDARHTVTTQAKRDAGLFGGPAKVGGTGAANEVATACILDSYRIDGMRLGDIEGGRIASLISEQKAKGDGYYLNAKVLAVFEPLVPKDKTIRQAVKPRKAEQLVKSIAAGAGHGEVVTTAARRTKQTLRPELATAGG